MKKKKWIWATPIAVVLVVLFLIKFNTNIYLSFEGGEELVFVNATVKIDNTVIYDNVTLSPELSGINVKLEKIPLRMGFHRIEASSENEDATLKKTIFILFNHYIMITYWEGRKQFTVHTGFNPYLFM